MNVGQMNVGQMIVGLMIVGLLNATHFSSLIKIIKKLLNHNAFNRM
jgi:hypothetical protein